MTDTLVKEQVKKEQREEFTAARAIARNAKRIAAALPAQTVAKIAALQSKVEVATFELEQVKRETASAVAGLFEQF